MVSDLILLACIVNLVFISGFVDDMKKILSYILTNGVIVTTNYTLKPIFCAICCTFWTCVVYLFICHQMTLFNVFISLVLACSSDLIESIFYLLKDLLNHIIKKISDLL